MQLKQVKKLGDTPEEKSRKIQELGSNLVLNLIKKYLLARDQRQELDKTSKLMKEQEQALEQELWILMESMGFKSINTDFGLITRTFRNNPYIVDFPLFRRWCRENEQMELVQEQAKRQALRDYINSRLQEYDSDAIPPGVEWMSDKIIHVRGRIREEETE